MLTQKTNPNLTPTQKGNLLSFLNDYTVDARLKNELRDSLKKAGLDLGNIQPKYDPTRLFKKGDRAEVVERNGRTPTCFPVGRIKVGDIVTVAENEAGDVFIKVLTKEGHKMMVPWFMLELISPVEERERYSVHHSTAGIWQVIDTKDNGIISNYVGHRHPNAKAAAEAECDRLNAEWRKEQTND